MSNRVDQDQPLGEGISDNDYKSRPGQGEIPVDSDERAEKATGILEGEIDPKADSDAQLEKDEKEAIDQSNILDSRTRGAAKEAGTYREPGDEEGLPGPDDGTSAVAK